MKVIWNLEETIAIPVSNIKEFEVATTDEWSKESKAKWTGGRYYVIARYAIGACGNNVRVFTSDFKEDCIQFIEKI